MFELIFVLYLFTGLFKRILLSMHIDFPVDITLLFGVLTLFTAFFEARKGNAFSLKHYFEKSKKHLSLYFLFGFYVWCLITISYGLGHYYPLKKSVNFLTNLLPVAALFIHPHIQLKKLSGYIIALSTVFAVFYFLFSPDMRYYKNPELYFLDYTKLKGMFLIITIMLGISVFLIWKYVSHVYVKTLLIYFFLFSLVYSSARGSYVSMFFSLLLFGFVFRNELKIFWLEQLKPRMKGVGFSLIALNFVLAVMIAVDVDKLATLNRSLYKLNLMAGSLGSKDNAFSIASFMDEDMMDGSGQEWLTDIKKEENSSIFARVWHSMFVWNTLKDNPNVLVFGAGFGSYGYLCCETDNRSNYPHNLFLEILIETGIIGLLIFSGFLFYLVRSAITKRHLWIFAFCVLFIFLNMMKSFSLVDIRIFFAFAAIVLFVPKIERT